MFLRSPPDVPAFRSEVTLHTHPFHPVRIDHFISCEFAGELYTDCTRVMFSCRAC